MLCWGGTQNAESGVCCQITAVGPGYSQITTCVDAKEDNDDDLSPGAIAGIAVGGAVFLALVGYGIYRYRSAKTSSTSNIAAPVNAPAVTSTRLFF